MPTVYIDGKKHTPSSGTLKKMKRKAEAMKATKAKTPKAKAKEKPPVPKDRPKKAKEPVKGLTLPSASVAKSNAKTKQLKGPVPKKKEGKKGHGIEMGKYRLK